MTPPGARSAQHRRGRPGPSRFAGFAIAAACLAWVVHDIDLAEAARSAASIRWAWVPLAVLLDVGSYLCQGWRWERLLRPRGSPGVVRATQAVYAGLFTNEVLPARLGEAVRAYLVRRWTGASYASIVSSMLLERFCDAIWLAIGFAAVAVLVPLPRDLVIAGDALGIVVVAATAVFVALVLRQRHGTTPAAPAGAVGAAPRLLRVIRRLADELRAVGGTRAFYAALLLSLGIPLLQGVSLWVLLVGYGFGLSPWAGLAIFLIVHMGTALPNAPGNIGTYQLLCVLALQLFGIAKAPAAGFSVAAFVILTVPLWGLGALALARSGTSLAAIRRDMTSARPSQSAGSIR
jgi:hypothetical protein